MPRSRRLRLYEYVGELVGAGVDVLVRDLALPPAKARQVMLDVAQAVCFRNAKSTVYIPEAANLSNVARNARIWAEYQEDGPPPTCCRKYSPQRSLELAAQYDLSPQQIYNILRGAREQEVSERQGLLEV